MKDRTIPRVIYLQWNCDNRFPEDEHPNPDDVTWCKDQIHGDDIRYVIDRRHLKQKRAQVAAEKARGKS